MSTLEDTTEYMMYIWVKWLGILGGHDFEVRKIERIKQNKKRSRARTGIKVLQKKQWVGLVKCGQQWVGLVICGQQWVVCAETFS